MKEVKVRRDEWYPVYDIGEYGDPVELTDEDYKFVIRALREFDTAQTILSQALKRAQEPSEINEKM